LSRSAQSAFWREIQTPGPSRLSPQPLSWQSISLEFVVWVDVLVVDVDVLVVDVDVLVVDVDVFVVDVDVLVVDVVLSLQQAQFPFRISLFPGFLHESSLTQLPGGYEREVA